MYICALFSVHFRPDRKIEYLQARRVSRKVSKVCWIYDMNAILHDLKMIPVGLSSSLGLEFWVQVWVLGLQNAACFYSHDYVQC